MNDSVAAYLDKVRERMNRRLTFPVTSPTAMLGAIESAGDVPRILAALDVALEFHAPLRVLSQYVCACCLDAYGEHEAWPCDEYRAISAVLLGDGATVDRTVRDMEAKEGER